MARSRPIEGLNEFVTCELCKAFCTRCNATKLGWDWFTGYLTRTHHYCKKHVDSPQYKAKLAESKVKP